RTIGSRAIPTTATPPRMREKLAELGHLGGVPRGFPSVSSASSFRVARRLRVGPFSVSGRSAARLARLVRDQEVGGSNPLAPTHRRPSLAMDSVAGLFLGELMFQSRGLGPSDSVPEACSALAERMDLPSGGHVALGPPGAAYLATPP